jgi:hypothetical protein
MTATGEGQLLADSGECRLMATESKGRATNAGRERRLLMDGDE